MKKIWTVLFVLAVTAPAAAQRGTAEPQDLETAKVLQEKLSAALREQKIVGEVRARTAVEGRIIPNAPYSAEAVTESTQVLADGNRINRKSATRVYRDGEGRTRREELNDSGTVVSVSIVDPVAHVTYVLNPNQTPQTIKALSNTKTHIKITSAPGRAQMPQCRRPASASRQTARGRPDRRSHRRKAAATGPSEPHEFAS